MTTWAYKDGLVAADRCVSGSQAILGTTNKISVVDAWWKGEKGRTDRNAVIVSAGNCGLVQWIHRQVMMGITDCVVQEFTSNPIRMPEGLVLPEDFAFQTAIFVEKADYYWITTEGDHGFWCKLRMQPWIAGGAGADYALGAMVAGMSAEQAVRIASMFDHGTNDQIDIAKVNP